MSFDKALILAFLLTLSAGHFLSLLFFKSRMLSFRWRTFLFILTASLGVVCPLWIPNRFPAARCLAAVTIIIFIFKNWDMHLHSIRYQQFTVTQYAIFLMDHCLFVFNNKNGLRNNDAIVDRLRYFLLETIYLSLSILALFVIFRWNWSTLPFWFEHTVKSTASGIWLIYAWDWYRAIWHLAGYKTVEFTNNLRLAYSPAEFWRRYHCEVHRWLYLSVFKPLKRFMRPVAALLLAFAVSGLAHEYAVSIALGRPSGYMFLFFLLNSLAVAATWRLKLSGICKYLGLVLTYIFLVITSVFFFLPVNEGIPFYSNQAPSWIQPW